MPESKQEEEPQCPHLQLLSLTTAVSSVPGFRFSGTHTEQPDVSHTSAPRCPHNPLEPGKDFPLTSFLKEISSMCYFFLSLFLPEKPYGRTRNLAYY